MRPLLLAGVLLLSTLSVQAAPVVKCGKLSMYNLCKIETGRSSILLVDGAYGGEAIDVDCDTGKWTANGPNTTEFVEEIVSLYCNY